MNKKIHILLLEDSPTDAELIERELQKGNFSFVLLRVTTRNTYQNALEEFKPDIILADHKLPSFDGISALRIVEEWCPDIPFIFISGYRGEELAVETLKSGAKDYILKDNLSRLVPSVRLALNEREEQIKRKQAEEALQRSQERLKLAQEAARIGTFDWNIQTNEIALTSELEALYGLKPGEFKGTYEHWREIVHPYDRKRAEQDVFRSIKEQKQLDTEYRVIWPDTSVHWVATKGKTFYDTGGKPLRMVGVNIDITERKRAEEDRIRLMNQIQLLLESTNEGIYGVDLKGNITFINRAAADMFGYTIHELTGKNIYTLIYKKNRDVPVKGSHPILEAIKSKYPVYRTDECLCRNDGTLVYIESSYCPVLENGIIQGIVVLSRDVSVRKRAEIELQNSKRQLEIIFQTVADGIFVFDKKGKLIYANDISARLNGFPPVQEILKISDLAGLWKEYRRRFEITNELGNPLFLKELPTNRVLNGEPDPEAIFSFKDRSKNTICWVLIKSRPVFDAQGNLEMVVNIISDITEYKEQERRKDEFIIAASHELKTPVTSLKAFAQLLKKMIERNEDKKYRLYITKIDKQTDKLTKLVNELLDLSRIQIGKMELKKKHFDLNTWIRDIAKDIQTSTNNHTITTKGKITRKIYGDKDRLSQVVTNLLSNAIKYSPETDKVIIELSEDKDKATIAIQDSGIGIEEEYQDKIFDRFFRVNEGNKKTFPGLGMGLYISQQIIRQHGGQIWVESAKGKGAIFSFTVPFKKTIPVVR
ncbi:MAG: PAS domain S-box protein [wastewater metagenome]|nr:PAS domain S-box protein [Candidatus Loosdrechtia aerotolerans]